MIWCLDLLDNKGWALDGWSHGLGCSWWFGWSWVWCLEWLGWGVYAFPYIWVILFPHRWLFSLLKPLLYHLLLLFDHFSLGSSALLWGVHWYYYILLYLIFSIILVFIYILNIIGHFLIIFLICLKLICKPESLGPELFIHFFFLLLSFWFEYILLLRLFFLFE